MIHNKNIFKHSSFIKVVFHLSSHSDDGVLSHREFIVVMKNQLVRGLENVRENGFLKNVNNAEHCIGQMLTIFNIDLCL